MTPERLTALAGAVEAAPRAAIDAALLDLHGAVGGDSQAGTAAMAGGLGLAADVRSALVDGALEAVAAHHGEAPLSPGLPLPRARAVLLRRLRTLVTIERRDADAAAATVAGLIDALVADGRIARRGDALGDPSLAGGPPAELEAAMDRLESALAVAAPPPLAAAAAEAGCPFEGVRALQADGRIIRIGADLAWAASTYQALAAVALDRARAAPLTPAAFRDLTGTSRRYVLAILEDLDRRGILQRTPEGHIPGARAPGRGAAT
jgi:hypothetical protein